MTELVSHRMARNKTFSNGDGTRTEIATLADLHFESVIDSGVFDAEVDCSPVRVTSAQLDGWRVVQSGWHYALGQPGDKESDGWLGFGGRQGAHWLRFRLLRVGYLHWPTRAWEDVGGAPDYDRANLGHETRGRELYPGVSLNLASLNQWNNIWTTPGGGSLSARWQASGGDLKEDVVINEAAREWMAAERPPSSPIGETWFGFIFALDWSDIPRILSGGVPQNRDADWSPSGLPVELRDAADRLLAFLPAGHVRVGEGKPSVLGLQKRFWKENGQHYLLIGARVDRINALPAGDLVFDPTVNPQVGASADDAVSWEGDGFTAVGDAIFIGDDGGWNHGGMRFTLNVPAGATISASTITFTAESDRSGTTVRSNIHYEDANDPSDFSGDDFAAFEARTRSAASVAWDGLAAWTKDSEYATVDVSSVAQALVNEAYWSSGEHGVLFVEDDGSDSNAYRRAYTYDGSSSDAAVWNVTYTTGGLPVISGEGIHSLVFGGVTVR